MTAQIPGRQAQAVALATAYELVDAVGPNVTGIQPADHAVLSSARRAAAAGCAQGRSVLCGGHTGDRFKNHDGTACVHHNAEDLSVLARMGSFAEQVVIPAEQIVPVRNNVPM